MPSSKTPSKELALRVGLLELAITLLALVFVRREIYVAAQFKSLLLPWQEYVMLAFMFAAGYLRGYGELQGKGLLISPFRLKSLRYLIPITLFLFVACASLCERVNIACVRQDWWRDLGLLILGSGVYLLAWQQKTRPPELEIEPARIPDFSSSEDQQNQLQTEQDSLPGVSESTEDDEILARAKKEISAEGPWKILRYPDRCSVLLELIGISMTLSAWMPLLCLPGLIIAFKWEIADLENSRIKQIGEKYNEYRKNSFHLIPYVY